MEAILLQKRYMVRPMKRADLSTVVQVHLESFPNFFLSFLGSFFLRGVYSSILTESSGISFVAEGEGSVVGFVAGTTQPSYFYKRLIHKRLWYFCFASCIPVLKRPSILPRLLRALRMPEQTAHKESRGTLMSIGVSPAIQATGIGRDLAKAFLLEARNRGLKQVDLQTDFRNNEKARRFYKKLGFTGSKYIVTAEGREMLEYCIDLLPRVSQSSSQDVQKVDSNTRKDGEALEFSKWLSRRSIRVIRTASSYWHENGPHFYQSFPYHCLIDPDPDELRQLFAKHRTIGVRYSSNVKLHEGAISYHTVFTQREYPIGALLKKARYDVRRGLSLGHVERIPLSRLATDGWHARTDTLVRQGRSGAENPRWWARLCNSAEGLSGFEAWACIVDNQLAASLLAHTAGEVCSILYQQSMTKHLRNGVNNALTFKFTEDVLSRGHVSSIFYGLHSLDAPASVDEYKFRMRYSAKPTCQHVVFHPVLSPFLGALNNSIVTRAFKVIDGWHHSIPKIEGLLRLYFNGNRPLSEQVWPDCLSDCKERLIRDGGFAAG